MSILKEISEIDHVFNSLWCKYENIDQENIIETKLLEKLGYFNHFGHHLCGPGNLSHHDIISSSIKGRFASGKLESNPFFFTPAACLNLYEPLFKLAEGKDFFVITSLAQVFRNEANYNSYRKLSFWVREFLFFGTRENIEKEVNAITSSLLKLLNAKKGAIALEPATDSFVPSRFQNIIISKQRKESVKYEFIATEANISFASINYHKQHFIKKFNADAVGFETACIGLGLSRIKELIKDNILEVSNEN